MKAYLGNTELTNVRSGEVIIRKISDGISTDIPNKVQNYLTASGITGSDEIIAVTYLYNALEDASLLDKLDVVYPMMGYTSQSNAVNLLDTGSFTLQFVNAVVFDDSGVTTDGTSSYANTNFAPSINSPLGQSVTNSFSMGLYSRTLGTANYDMGSQQTGGPGFQWALIINNSLDRFYPALPTSEFYTGSEITGFGMYQASRSGSLLLGSANESIVVNQPNAVTLRANIRNLLIGAIYEGSIAGDRIVEFSARNYSYGFIGRGLTQSDMKRHYYIVETFNRLLGRNTPLV